MPSSDYPQDNGTYPFPDPATTLQEGDNLPDEALWSLGHSTLDELRLIYSVARMLRDHD